MPKAEALDDGQAGLLHLSGLSWPYPEELRELSDSRAQVLEEARADLRQRAERAEAEVGTLRRERDELRAALQARGETAAAEASTAGVHGGLLSVASTTFSRRISPACPERTLPASAVFWYRLAGLFLASLRERD